MTDRLHDHTTFGFRRGCVACAQVEADMALSARAFHAKAETSASQSPMIYRGVVRNDSARARGVDSAPEPSWERENRYPAHI